MTGRDAARDELAKTIQAYGPRFGYAVDIHLADCIAGAVLHAGYRKVAVVHWGAEEVTDARKPQRTPHPQKGPEVESNEVNDDHWQVTVTVPLRLPIARRAALFDAVAAAAHAWEEAANPDGWNVNVAGGPEVERVSLESAALDELFDAYQAAAEVITARRSDTPTGSYELGYLDALADALHHAGWALEGEHRRVVGDDAFPSLASSLPPLKRAVLTALLVQRRARRAKNKTSERGAH